MLGLSVMNNENIFGEKNEKNHAVAKATIAVFFYLFIYFLMLFHTHTHKIERKKNGVVKFNFKWWLIYRKFCVLEVAAVKFSATVPLSVLSP